MGDNIWLSNRFTYSQYNGVCNVEKTIYALDYYYTRAFGNFNNYIKENDYVNLRRYLNCVWQILSIEWIRVKGYRPPNSLKKLMNIIEEDKIRRMIINLYKTNCNSFIDKRKLYVIPDNIINEYIEKKLKDQRCFLNHYNKGERIASLISKTPEDAKQLIVQINF